MTGVRPAWQARGRVGGSVVAGVWHRGARGKRIGRILGIDIADPGWRRRPRDARRRRGGPARRRAQRAPAGRRGGACTWSTPAASGSGRCWSRSPRSSATRPRGPRFVDAAIVVELTHLATLYHDDVMDEAHVRRGAPSANSRWTNSVAILVGDYLFARAASVAADLGPEAVRIQADTFARLVHGQIAETVGPRTATTRSSTTCM